MDEARGVRRMGEKMKGCGSDGLLPLPGHLAIAVRDFWHCLHIMRSRVYEMVQCPSERSICLPVPAWAHSSKPAAAGLLLWAQPAGTIDWLLQQQVDKCRQRHSVRVHSSWTHRLTWHYAHAKCCVLVHFESEKNMLCNKWSRNTRDTAFTLNKQLTDYLFISRMLQWL